MSAYLDIRLKNGLSFPNSSGLKVLEQYDPIYFIRLYIDSDKEYTKLHASKTVHHIPVEPGAHLVIISRRLVGKTTLTDIGYIAFGGVLGGLAGGSGMGAMSVDMAQRFITENHLDNARVLEFHEGQTISCEVRPDWHGQPKITWL